MICDGRVAQHVTEERDADSKQPHDLPLSPVRTTIGFRVCVVTFSKRSIDDGCGLIYFRFEVASDVSLVPDE